MVTGGFIVFFETVPGTILVAVKRGTFKLCSFPSVFFSCGSVLWVQDCLDFFSRDLGPSFLNRSQPRKALTSKETIDMGDPNNVWDPGAKQMLLLEGNRCFCIILRQNSNENDKDRRNGFFSPRKFRYCLQDIHPVANDGANLCTVWMVPDWWQIRNWRNGFSRN